MNIPLSPRTVLKPSIISMAAVTASFAAWLFPSFGVLRKGFESPAHLDVGAFVVLACWYLLIFVSFIVGEQLGAFLFLRTRAPESPWFSLESNVLYCAFTVLTTIGI